MPRINNTTTFPNTQPGPGDHVIGTDISDTSNDVNGEVVTFRVEDICDVADGSAAWHPYDADFLGDGSTGIFYDHSTDGTVSSATTPTFEDGYEYMIRLLSVSPSGSTNYLIFTLNLSGGGTPDVPISANTTYDTSAGYSGLIHIPNTRHSRAFHKFIQIAPVHEFGSTSTSFVDETGTSLQSTSNKVNSVSVRWNSGDIDGGSIKLYRRRDGTSL